LLRRPAEKALPVPRNMMSTIAASVGVVEP
jgi:hypothetical protein